jgi:TP901 family phage tail tape measure protein
MALSVRELVFYIRAEDQATRTIKRVASSFRGLTDIKQIQKRIAIQPQLNQKAWDQATLAIRKNDEAILGNTRAIEANRAALKRNAADISRYKRLLDMAQKSTKGMAGGRTTDELTKMLAAARNMTRSLTAEKARLTSETERNTIAEEANAKALQDVARKAAAATAALDLELAGAKISRWQGIASGIQSVARSARLMGVIVGASLAFAARRAADFQTQLTLAASQARPIGAGPQATLGISNRLQNVVLAQMQKFPAASQDMADSLYQIFSSTNIQNIGKAAQMLQLFNQAAVAGGASLKSMTDAGITLLNNFVGADNEFKTLGAAFDRFFAAVRYGRMNADQFATSLSYVAGIAKEAGLGFTDVADAMATLTRQTGAKATTRDAQGLARLIQQLSSPEAIAGLKQLGINAIDPLTMKLRPLLEIVTEIKKRADLRGVNALNFFKQITALGGGGVGTKGTIQAQRAFAFLINNLAEYQRVSKEVNSDNGELRKSFEALSRSPGIQWQIMMNQLKAFTIVIGRDAIPALVKLLQPLVNLFHWFNNLNESTKKSIANWAVWGSAIAVVGGTITILAGAIAKAALSLKLLQLTKAAEAAAKLAAEGEAAAGVIAKFSSEVGATTPKLVLLLGKFTLLITAFLVIQKFTHNVGQTLKYLFDIILVVGIYRLITLAAKIREAASAMVLLRAVTMPEVAAAILLGAAFAKAASWLADLDRGSSTIDVTRQHLNKLKQDLTDLTKEQKKQQEQQRRVIPQPPGPLSPLIKPTPSWVTQGQPQGAQAVLNQIQRQQQQARIGWVRTFSNMDKLAALFKALPKSWQTQIHVKLDKNELKQIQDEITKLEETKPHPTRASTERQIIDMFPFLNAKQVKSMAARVMQEVNLARSSQFTEASRLANFITPIPLSAAGQTTAALTNKEMLAAAEHAAQLQQNLDNVTDPKKFIPAWHKYDSFVSGIMKQLTKTGKRQWGDLLTYVENSIPQVLTSLSAASLKTIQHIAVLQEKLDQLSPGEAWNKAYVKFHNAWNKFLATLPKAQQQQAQDALSAFTQSFKAPTTVARLPAGFGSTLQEAYRLQQQVQKAPNYNAWYTATRRFQTFWNAHMKGMSQAAQQMANDALAAFSQFGTTTMALPAAVALAQHVEKLHQLALAAGADSKYWDQYNAAAKQLNAIDPTTLQNANDIIQNQGEVAKYSTEQILKMALALQKLTAAAALDPGNLKLQERLQAASKAYGDAATTAQSAAVSPVVAAHPIVPQSVITGLIEQIRAVDKAAERGPLSAAAWIRYYHLVDRLATLAVGHQEDIGNKLADNAERVTSISLAAAVRMSRRLIALQELASKSPTIANWKRFFALQTKYGQMASDAIQQQADQIAQAQADAAKAAQQKAQDDAKAAYQKYIDHLNQIRDAAIDKARQAVDTAKQTLRQVLDDAKSQYQGFLGTLGQGPFITSAYMQNRLQYGFQLRPKDYLKDIQMATKQAQSFAGSLDKIRARASKVGGIKIAQELTSQLAALGNTKEARQMLKGYLEMTPDQFNQLITAFKNGQAAADKYAHEQLRAQIKVWETYGKNIAQAIITGVKSQTPQFDDYIKNLVKTLFPGLVAKSKQKTSGEGAGYHTPDSGGSGSGGTTTTKLPDSSPYSPNYTKWYNQHFNWHGTGYPEGMAKKLGLGGFANDMRSLQSVGANKNVKRLMNVRLPANLHPAVREAIRAGQVMSPGFIPYGSNVSALGVHVRPEARAPTPDTAGDRIINAAHRSLLGITQKALPIVSQTLRQYPTLNKYMSQFAFKQSGANAPGSGGGAYGSESYYRGESTSFDPRKMAIQLFGNKNRPADVAGEMVSHFLARGIDPTLTRLYNQFKKTITPQEVAWMKFSQKREGDTRPFAQYERMSGIPALFRGKLFHQLDSGDVTYTKEQLRIFKSVDDYLSGKKSRSIRGTSDKRTEQNVDKKTIHNVTYNIHPTQKGEGLESMLRRSHFYYRNRMTNL